jgi:hypothetical protein
MRRRAGLGPLMAAMSPSDRHRHRMSPPDPLLTVVNGGLRDFRSATPVDCRADDFQEGPEGILKGFDSLMVRSFFWYHPCGA